MEAPQRVPMWVVDRRFWHAHPDADLLERSRLHNDAADEWMEAHPDMPGLDPFDYVDSAGHLRSDGAWALAAAEAAIRRGERW